MLSISAKVTSIQRIYLCGMQSRKVYVEDLGRMGYAEAWDLQERLLKQNLEIKAAQHRERPGAPPETLPTDHRFLFCEHHPVYTLGKSGKMEHLLLSETELTERGYSFFPTNRGGDITYHGPGQIVGYPILDLEKFRADIGWYLRNLEEVIIRAIGDFGISGARSSGETGVWIDPDQPGRERKICAMGVRCSRWITMHGFALNVNTLLSDFDNIVPCGIRGKQVASMHRELGRELPLKDVKASILKHFSAVFEAEVVLIGGSSE
jgi:lipoyl(octanoyl) transferase